MRTCLALQKLESVMQQPGCAADLPRRGPGEHEIPRFSCQSLVFAIVSADDNEAIATAAVC